MVGKKGSFEVISRVQVFCSMELGLKATLIVKFLQGLIVLLPLPLVILNIDPPSPLIAAVNMRSAVPLFVTTKEAVLFPLTFTYPKL